MTGPAPSALDPTVPSRRTGGSRRGLAAVGAALLLAAVVSTVAIAALQLDGYRWADRALVPADGRPHVVPVSGGRAAVLWQDESITSPDCTVTELASGSDLPLRTTDRILRREGGSAGDWVASATFAPTFDLVEVTCKPTGARPHSLVAVEAAPRVPRLAYFGPAALVPATLGVAGIALLVVASVGMKRIR